MHYHRERTMSSTSTNSLLDREKDGSMATHAKQLLRNQKFDVQAHHVLWTVRSPNVPGLRVSILPFFAHNSPNSMSTAKAKPTFFMPHVTKKGQRNLLTTSIWLH